MTDCPPSSSREATDAFLWRSGFPELWRRPDIDRDVGIAPNTARRWLSVLEASEQIFLLGFRKPADLVSHALWGAVWENFVVSEVQKRLHATAHPPALWFWRTAHGDEVDLLVETGPETFVAIECKAAERVESRATRGIVKLAAVACPANCLAHDSEAPTIALIGQLGPLRLDELQPPAGVRHEVDLARPVAPEEQAARTAGAALAVAQLREHPRLPYRPARRASRPRPSSA